jgi:transcription elongation factor S-II
MDKAEFRHHAYDVLENMEKFTSDDIARIEEAIYNRVAKPLEDISHQQYKELLYQVVGDALNQKNADCIINSLNKGQVGWKHKSFDDMKMRQDEQDEFVQNPFEVEEGVLECKCGSKRVYSYQKQTRGSDEPSTTFAECVACGKKWQYSG